jgi:hypothetical protein
MPVSRVGARDHANAPPFDEAARQQYARIITALLDIPPAPAPDGFPQPTKLHLDHVARAHLDAFRADLETQLRPGGRLERVADWINKAAGHTARIAGLLHLLTRRPVTEAIASATMLDAIEIGEYFVAHALVAFRAMGRDPAFEGAVRILRWFRERGLTDVSQRDIYLAHDTTYSTLAELRPALGLLMEKGYLRQTKILTGGRPSIRYQLNPLPPDTKGQKGQKPADQSGADPFDPSDPFAGGGHGEGCDCPTCIPSAPQTPPSDEEDV